MKRPTFYAFAGTVALVAGSVGVAVGTVPTTASLKACKTSGGLMILARSNGTCPKGNPITLNTRGATGARGATGSTGLQGPQGPPGVQGSPGAAGASLKSVTYSFDQPAFAEVDIPIPLGDGHAAHLVCSHISAPLCVVRASTGTQVNVSGVRTGMGTGTPLYGQEGPAVISTQPIETTGNSIGGVRIAAESANDAYGYTYFDETVVFPDGKSGAVTLSVFIAGSGREQVQLTYVPAGAA